MLRWSVCAYEFVFFSLLAFHSFACVSILSTAERIEVNNEGNFYSIIHWREIKFWIIFSVESFFFSLWRLLLLVACLFLCLLCFELKQWNGRRVNAIWIFNICIPHFSLCCAHFDSLSYSRLFCFKVQTIKIYYNGGRAIHEYVTSLFYTTLWMDLCLRMRCMSKQWTNTCSVGIA